MNDNLLIESYRDFTFIFDKNTNRSDILRRKYNEVWTNNQNR